MHSRPNKRHNTGVNFTRSVQLTAADSRARSELFMTTSDWTLYQVYMATTKINISIFRKWHSKQFKADAVILA